MAPTVLGLVAGVLVVGAATYPGRWFPASRQGPWFIEFPGLSSPGSKWVAFGVYYSAMAVLGLAWMWLLRVVRRAGSSVAAVLVVFAVWCLPFAMGPPVGSDDAVTYVASGRLVEQGIDPYHVGIVALGFDDPAVRAASPTWWESPQPYGPLYLRVATLASSLGGSSFRAEIMLLRLAGLACLGLLAFPLVALARRFGASPSAVLAFVLCGPLTVVHLVGGVHNETFMLLPLVTGVAVGAAGLASAGRRRVALVAAGAALCGVAAGVKVPALLGAAVLGWLSVPQGSSRKRVAAASGATALAGVVLVLVSLASGLGLGWLRNLDVSQKVFTILSPFTAAGTLVRNSLGHLGFTVDVVPGFRVAGVIAGLALVGWCVVRADRLGLPVALGSALTLAALTTPVVWAWYPTWGLVFLAIWSMPRWLQVAVVALNFTVTPLGPATLDVNTHPTVSSLLVLFVTAGGLVLFARHRPERQPAEGQSTGEVADPEGAGLLDAAEPALPGERAAAGEADHELAAVEALPRDDVGSSVAVHVAGPEDHRPADAPEPGSAPQELGSGRDSHPELA